jgi:hypothetical protein
MMIGRCGAATMAISAARADRVTVRGRGLAADLMGGLLAHRGEEAYAPIGYLLAAGEETIRHTAEESQGTDS